MKGLSDLYAVVIFIGLALVLSTIFIAFLSGYFVSRSEHVSLLGVVSSEKSNIVVRLLEARGLYVVFLFKRFERGYIYFFIYDDGSYEGCSGISDQDVYGGTIDAQYSYSLKDIIVVDESGVYDFPTYARSLGLPDEALAVVCKLYTHGNTIVRYMLFKPIASHVYVDVNASGGSWRLYGTLSFTLQEASTIRIDQLDLLLPPGTVITLELNTTVATIRMTESFVELLDIPSVERVYINHVLIDGSSHRVYMANTSISSYYSTLSINIQLNIDGSARITYDSTTIEFSSGDTVTITGLEPLNSPLNISLGHTLNAAGYASSILLGNPTETSISIFVVTVVNNKPVLVERYTYNITTTREDS